tara:strand:+ start:584 stop:904 length:321 start_codon:yes stop_codon:yes gene_type:complete
MSKVYNSEMQEHLLNNQIDNLEQDKAQLLDFLNEYRRYFRSLYSLINTSVIGGGFIDPETWDEILEQELESGSLDYFAMLGHLDSLEKQNKKFVQFPMMKHKDFLK